MGETAPKLYLVCDGAEYNISEYTELAEHINTNFGSYNFFGGDGTTTFAVPDMQGLFTRGYGGVSGEIGVKQDGTQIPSIYMNNSNNNLIVGNKTATALTLAENRDQILYNGSGTSRAIALPTSASSISYSHYTTRPDNMALLYCIKYSMGDDLSKTINQKSTFTANVNGQQNNWNANDQNTSYSPTVANVWQNIPSKFNVLVDDENSNKATHYMGISEDLQGLQLKGDISDFVKSIEFEIMAFLQNQVWYNSSLRLIAHSPDSDESEYMGDSFNFTGKTILLAESDFIASNSLRNASFNGRKLHTVLRNSETDEKITRNNWILRFQMRTDNTQDYISDKSFVTITFNDR